MPNYRVTANVLRIRSGPGTSHAIIGTLLRNAIVQGDEITGDWIHVTPSDNKTGWCHRDFLELLDETPPTPTQDTYRVDANTLNVRQGPGLNYAVIGSVKKGEVVEGLAISPDGLWAQIRTTSAVTGWSSLQYLTKATAPPPPGPSDIQMIVTTTTLNVRSGPGTGFSIIGQVHHGEIVTYLHATPAWDWVTIKTAQNTTGWCSARYLMERIDSFAPTEDYPATGLHRALTDSLSMREGPGESFTPVTELTANSVVAVDLISPDGKWKHCTNAWGASGWYPIERLAPLGNVAMQQEQEEFLYIPIAFAEFGTREIPGSRHNPRIQEYIKSTDLAKYPSLPDETEWCAAYLNWCIEKVGLPTPNSALVSQWRNWGSKPPAIRRGCVVTFRWDDGLEHASFYLGEVGNHIIGLGGNQSDAVWISVYHKKYITSFRLP